MPRERLLAAVRDALADVAPSAPPSDPGASLTVDRRTLADRFTAEARAVGTTVHIARTARDAASTLATILAALGAARIVAWPTPLARNVTLAAATPDLDVLLAASGTDLAAIARADVGITEADALVAASGTLVLRAASGARTVSLLPPVHVAVVPCARLVADLTTALRLVRRGDPPDACVTLVTGPSRTADIEKKLVVGVHGPCALHVILVDGAEA